MHMYVSIAGVATCSCSTEDPRLKHILEYVVQCVSSYSVGPDTHRMKEQETNVRGMVMLTASGPATLLVAVAPDLVVMELAVTPSTGVTGGGVGDGGTPRASTAT